MCTGFGKRTPAAASNIEHYYKMYQEEADFLISQTEEGLGIDEIRNGLGK